MTTDDRVSAPNQPEGRVHRPEIGDWNHFELAIGKRGAGKTTRLLESALDLDAISGGAYKIGHSMGQRFNPHVPSGRRVEIHYYESMARLEKGLGRKPNAFHILISDEAEPVLHYAKKLSAAIKRRSLGFFARNKSPMGREAAPIIVIIDEMVALDAASGSAQGGKTSKWFRKMLISLRHDHIALLAGVQDSNAISYLNTGLATRLYCFNMSHEWAIQSLKAGGMKDTVRLPDMAIGEHIVVDLALKPAGAHSVGHVASKTPATK